MTKEEQEFLEKNFKAGEYSAVTIMVKNDQLTRLLDVLRNANMTLAIIPSAQAGIDFADPKKTGTSQ